ncbi:unnamed protein product [Clavelina lepadiformis]|uniref:Uncharacterized protein n=1 Tax=Clavelina lepadiformis TaxID=159417 RepID=A0ABP0G678_CLALP
MKEVAAFPNNTERMYDTRVMRSLNAWSRLSDVPTIPKTKTCCGMELKFSKCAFIRVLFLVGLPYGLQAGEVSWREKGGFHGSRVGRESGEEGPGNRKSVTSWRARQDSTATPEIASLVIRTWQPDDDTTSLQSRSRGKTKTSTAYLTTHWLSELSKLEFAHKLCLELIQRVQLPQEDARSLRDRQVASSIPATRRNERNFREATDATFKAISQICPPVGVESIQTFSATPSTTDLSVILSKLRDMERETEAYQERNGHTISELRGDLRRVNDRMDAVLGDVGH